MLPLLDDSFQVAEPESSAASGFDFSAPAIACSIVAVVFGGGGYLMLQGGLRDLKNLDPTPRRTVESIKEDIQIAKERRS